MSDYELVKDIVNFLKAVRNKAMLVRTYLKEDKSFKEIKLIGNKNVTVTQLIKLLESRMVDAGTVERPCETLRFIGVMRNGTEVSFLKADSISETRNEIIFNLKT